MYPQPYLTRRLSSLTAANWPVASAYFAASCQRLPGPLGRKLALVVAATPRWSCPPVSTVETVPRRASLLAKVPYRSAAAHGLAA